MSFPKSSKPREGGEAGEAGELSLSWGCGMGEAAAGRGATSCLCCCWGAAHGFAGSCLESGRSRQPITGGGDTWQIPLQE